MREVDIKLLEQANTVLETMTQAYSDIDIEAMKNSEEKKKKDLSIEIQMFEAIIKECKEDSEDQNIEEVLHTLKLVYHLDLLKGGDSAVLAKLEALSEKFLSIQKKKYPINEKVLTQYRKNIPLVTAAADALTLRLKQLHSEERWYLPSKKDLINEYELLLESIQNLQEQMIDCFTLMSFMVTAHIVENFHYIYLFFLFLIKYYFYADNQMMLVEIASILDRFMKVIEPLNTKISLRGETLRNSYVLYELNVLKTLIINHYA